MRILCPVYVFSLGHLQMWPLFYVSSNTGCFVDYLAPDIVLGDNVKPQVLVTMIPGYYYRQCFNLFFVAFCFLSR